MGQLYPNSHVEISGFIASNYEHLLNLATFGFYHEFINQAVGLMQIKEEDKIIDLGAGTGYNELFIKKYLGKSGQVIALDIGQETIAEFKQKFKDYDNFRIERRRIDRELPYQSQFDKALTSFVLHGLPQKSRVKLVKNSNKALKRGGSFYLLDYGDFKFNQLPLFLKTPFKLIECDLAYDYLGRDWQDILKKLGFEIKFERNWLGDFVRLLQAKKVESI